MTSRALDLLTQADPPARTMRAAASAWQAIPATVARQTDSSVVLHRTQPVTTRMEAALRLRAALA